MAFVTESLRDFKELKRVTGSGDVGPGQYHNEGYYHKLAMDSIYPKKKAPFDSNTTRFKDSSRNSNSPGKLLKPIF
jgi:hypothetical protein